MAGRKTDFSWEKLETLVRVGSTKVACAMIMDCSEDTIENKLKKEFNCTFKQYRQKHLQFTSTKLQQKALQMAFAGDRVMLIFSLKNIAGWSEQGIGEDRPENYRRPESMIDDRKPKE